jgi:class 3 adenylate cyclase
LVAFGETWAAAWGKGEFSIELAAPSLVGDDGYVGWMARYEQQSLTPRGFADLWSMIGAIDVRDVLSSIQSPTTIIHRTDDTLNDVRQGRYLADHIPNARLVELTGRDHFPWVGNQDAVLDVIEEVVTGVTARPRLDRMLAVVLFTDIVDSTHQAIALGDAAWRGLLDAHDRITATVIGAHRGRVVNTTGDGVLATFSSPSDAIDATRSLHRQLASMDVPIRAGLHAGEVERRGDDITGIGVHIASRICALAGSGQTIVSSTIKDLTAGAGIRFIEIGLTALRGIDQPWKLFNVEAK